MSELTPAQQLRTGLDSALTATFDGEPREEDIPCTSYVAASLLMTGVLDNLGSLPPADR